MPDVIGSPTFIETPGSMKKTVEEFFGIINSNEVKVSIAHICSPAGWQGPGQTADFDEAP